jgi:copper homeostasis protein CutC
VFAVPSAAIVRGEGGTFIFAHRAGEVMAAAVQIVAESPSHAFVRGDLDRDVGVAVDGVAALKSVWLSAGSEDE